MTNPRISTLTDIFLPDGYGYFGYGDGTYGGYAELLNPQWNTNSGNFGIDPVTGLPSIEATSSPSYVGASFYNAEFSSFFAKIVPAPNGTGTIQTSLLIKADAYNYVEMSVGPDGLFNAYVSNDTTVTVTSSPLPTYDPVAHAFWRIRNDDRILFHFDASPDGITWTELGNVAYTWDASSVTVMLFVGFTGLENPGQLAYVTNVNLPTGLTLSSTGGASAGGTGAVTVTSPNALSGSLSAQAGFKASFNVTLGIPEGGLTDFAYTYNTQSVDPMMINDWNQIEITEFFGGNITSANWVQGSYPYTVPSQYRDGSYWPAAAYATLDTNVVFTPDVAANLMALVQVEKTTGLSNRLSLNSSLYLDWCAYSPGSGVATVTRSTDHPLTGQYSGKIVGNGQNGTLAAGPFAYWIRPDSSSMVPVRFDEFGNAENVFGSVYLSTTRANTQWFASTVVYDATFNILAETTYHQPTITNYNTHPGGGVYQPGNVYATNLSVNAAWVAIVPVIVVPTANFSETVYTSSTFLSGATLYATEVASDYVQPRTAEINVKADRVNYVINSGFNIDNTGWFQTNTNTTGSPNPVTMSHDATVGYNSTGSLKCSFVAPSGSFTGTPGVSQLGAGTPTNFSGGFDVYPPVQGLKPGHTYTVSAWVNQGPGCPDVLMNFYDKNFNGVTQISANQTLSNYPDRVSGNWIRLQATFTVSPLGLYDYGFYFYVNYSDYLTATKPFSFWIDSLLVEESVNYNGYFNGGFSSADYQYEAGKDVFGKSYYYKDYNNKFLRLNKALSSVMPVGEHFNLLFAQPLT